MPQRNQEKDSNSGVNLVEIWGSWIRVKKISISTGKFQIFQAILQKNIEFCRQIFENFDFFRLLKKLIYQAKKSPFTATSGQIILFLFKSNHFRTYFPVHDKIYFTTRPRLQRPPCDPPFNPLPKIWGSRPSAPRITAPG